MTDRQIFAALVGVDAVVWVAVFSVSPASGLLSALYANLAVIATNVIGTIAMILAMTLNARQK